MHRPHIALVGRQELCRDTFVRFNAAGWRCVLYDSKVDLETCSCSWMSLLIAEEGFAVSRSAAKYFRSTRAAKAP